jgi:CheY-like chemotaxis protein
LVEDEPVTRNALQQLLQTAGASVRAAASAAEAIEIFDAHRPDVLVSDIAMPVHDGLWLIDQIRQIESRRESPDEPAKQAVPAIALTAHAYAGDRIKCMEAGFQVHLSKPIEPDDLIATIATFAPDQTPQGTYRRSRHGDTSG